MTQRLFSKAGLLILALLTLLMTIGINQLFKGARLDLTEDKLYTLSDGSHNLMKQLDNTATLQFFYSEGQTGEIPVLRNYASRVTELLGEYVLASNGKLKLEVIDPEPFSENEDKAAQYGLQAVPLDGSGREAYMGLVIINDKDDSKKEVISFLHPDKEQFLEYDISKLIYSVTQEGKPKIGLISGLPVNGGYDPQIGQPTGPWISLSQLKQTYDVQGLSDNIDDVPEDIGLLVIIHPKALSDKTQYAIDQFVLRGGHALIFVDPDAEIDQAGRGMMANMGGSHSSTLDPLFQAWGIDYDPQKVLADATAALPVSSPSGRPVRHLGVLGLIKNNFTTSDVITSNLNNVNFSTAGAIKKAEQGATNVEVLVHSSNNAMLMDADKFTMLSNPSSLYKSFAATGDQYALVVRVSGDVKTAFPEGRPIEQKEENKEAEKTNSKKAGNSGKVAKNEDEKDQEQGKAQEEELLPHIEDSKSSIQVIIVADADVLTDRLWVQKNQFFGREMLQPFADNGDLFMNMVDNLLGNAELTSIRSRGQFARPFDKVDELESRAEANFHKKEDELKLQLTETERKLRELQTKDEGQDSLVLSPEQEKEVQRFMEQKLKIRKELREVQHQLGKEIKQLGTRVKLINIIAMPLLITLVAVGYRGFRRKRK